jgi:hypothetical protein
MVMKGDLVTGHDQFLLVMTNWSPSRGDPIRIFEENKTNRKEFMPNLMFSIERKFLQTP